MNLFVKPPSGVVGIQMKYDELQTYDGLARRAISLNQRFPSLVWVKL